MHLRTRSTLLISLLLGSLLALGLTSMAVAAETTLTATLAGSAETDEDGSGTATVVLDPDAATACWEITVENIDPVTVSHIHEGAEGADGGVVVDLDLDGFEGTSEGCNEAADAETLQAIIDAPAGYYVNVHNEAFPGGAIRGQLVASTDSPNTALPAEDPPFALVGGVALAAAAALVVRRRTREVATRAD
jgi:hypothetical protein